MIYEMAIVARSDASEQQLAKLHESLELGASEFAGELILRDDWGKRLLAQPTKNGTQNGHFLYYVFKGNNPGLNPELSRRLRINEAVIKYFIVKLGEDSEKEALVKAYKTPYSKAYNGSVTDENEENEDIEGSRKFSRSKACWFTTRKIRADWKDPKTYNWLVNEFGKISAARVSNISRKHQRFANTAIKRARQIGLISHLSNRFAE